MRKFLLGAAGLAALVMAAPASAADLPARPYVKASQMIPALYDWSGFYLGINGGWGSSHKCWDITRNAGVIINPAAPEGCHDATGAAAGGQIGYRWQASSWVFGVEGQGDWTNFKGSNTSLFFTVPPLVRNQTKINGFGTITGQVGYAMDNVLFYGKGGVAAVGDKYTTFNIPTGGIVDRGSEIRWGGVAGAGIEFAFATDWSVAAEYDHMFMGTKSVNFFGVGNFGIPAGALSATDRIRQDVDVGTVRINYRWGGPVISKY